MTSPFVIVIAGPAAVGKTTIAKMLVVHFKCTHISEDEIAKELFPDLYIEIEKYPNKQKLVESELLNRAKEIFDKGESVVVDRINLDEKFIKELKTMFQKNLILKIIFPPIETTIERDNKRDCWTSGEAAIREFYYQYEKLKPIIGEENFIDNSHQTPEETLAVFIKILN